MAKYIGCDKNGIPRVYGEARQPHVAFIECQRAVLEYVRQRPDTAPASDWLIEYVSQRPWGSNPNLIDCNHVNRITKALG